MRILILSEKRNVQASEVLLKIRQKLDGVDGGRSALTVEGHVNHLIEVCVNRRCLSVPVKMRARMSRRGLT